MTEKKAIDPLSPKTGTCQQPGPSEENPGPPGCYVGPPSWGELNFPTIFRQPVNLSSRMSRSSAMRSGESLEILQQRQKREKTSILEGEVHIKAPSNPKFSDSLPG